MEIKAVQHIVYSKYEQGEGPSKIFRDLSGAVSLCTVKRWCKMIRETGSIELSCLSGCPRIVQTPGTIEKVKHRLQRKQPISSRKLALEFGMSRTSMRRIIKKDLGLRPYKRIREPMLT